MENQKSKKGLLAVGAVLLSGCLLASLGLNVSLTRQTLAQNKKVNKFINNQLERQAKEEELENQYQEDGYVVAEAYEIRSTKQISDAYLKNDDSKLSKEDKETLDMAKKVIKKVIKKDMSDFEKEEAVFNWMVKTMGHGSGTIVTLPGVNGDAFTPHDVLKAKSGVCVGYATTFRLFMQMLGMDCHIVHNESHSWDLVQLDDGEWYHVDIYSSIDGSKYGNFNMTDAMARTGHSWEESGLPAAEGTKYTPAVMYQKQVKNIYQVPAKVKKAMDKKKDSLFFSFKEKLKEKDLVIADTLMTQLNNAVSMLGNGDYYLEGSWSQGEDDEYILGIYINDYNGSETDNTDISKEKQDKLNAAIQKAFGVDVSDMAGYYDDVSNMRDDMAMEEGMDADTVEYADEEGA